MMLPKFGEAFQQLSAFCLPPLSALAETRSPPPNNLLFLSKLSTFIGGISESSTPPILINNWHYLVESVIHFVSVCEPLLNPLLDNDTTCEKPLIFIIWPVLKNFL